jgi:hypothetical protein
MKLLLSFASAVIGATVGYGIAVVLSPTNAPAYIAIITALFGGVVLSAVTSGIYSAFTAK